ncbi:MAG: glycosyltransferase family 9 protein [Verrucomicrobiae bacterium]|nr:glycosyltransferase family 9 protein [Verrucomicrobiae bacterium]
MAADPSTLYERTRDARRILVVDLGFLGDSVHLVPACWDLKRHYPEARIETLSAPVGGELLAMAPCVDRAWIYPLGNPSPPWWRHLGILREIRRQRFDLALSFGAADRAVFITALSGARHRVVHNRGRKHFYNPWILPHWVPLQPRDRSILEQRRGVLSAMGLTPGPVRFDLRIPDADRAWAAAELPERVIHVSPSASHALKEWPIEHWCALVPQLAARSGAVLVATGDGSARERERLQRLADSAGPRAKIFGERLSLARLAALLERSALHVGADSGVTHLAAALGVRTVTVYREYDGRTEWSPPGANHRQCVVDCACIASTRPGPECAGPQRAACLARITPDQLLAECVTAWREGMAPK